MRRRAPCAPATVIALHPRAEEPPFDPPDATEIEAMGAAPEPAEELPFDPPEADDDIFRPYAQREPEPEPPPLPTFACAPPPPTAKDAPPLPAIEIFAAWDRPAAQSVFEQLAVDPRFARARLRISRGGLDAAAAYCRAAPRPALILADTTLHGANLLAAIQRLSGAIAAGVKVVILGAVNDVTLLRDLAARGVNEYLVTPVSADDLAASLCALFAEAEVARTIAVIGARGGVGASSLARNLAWSIAERQDAATILADLDICFGDAGIGFNLQPPLAQSAEAAPALARLTANLEILHAPPTPALADGFDQAGLDSLIARLRRASAFSVLDLPHLWTPWVRAALIAADEVVLVAGADLASLRNADNLLKQLQADRPGKAAAHIVLSMTGMPKRPEISLKDFVQALKAEPAATLPFDPALFGAATMKGAAIGAVAPDTKIARDIDTLASRLTGRGLAAPMPGRVRAAPPTTPLDLKLENATPPEAQYLAAARAAARASTPAEPAPRQRRLRRKSTGLVRRIAALITLLFASIWWLQIERQGASAAEPERSANAASESSQLERFSAALDALAAGRSEAGAAALRALAEEGYVAAYHRLAKLYESGRGVEANLTRARHWTQRAAEAGDARAMHDLGVYFASGEGGVRDDAAAFLWFRRAAERGVTDSQYNLGVLYQTGRGVSADAAEALFWFVLAARSGDTGAAAHAEELATTLTPMQVEQARFRAESFRTQTAAR
ncbi:MAG: SEL1-like repeat protein [Hyphomonadaceae bacterium]|nr:SEL1-like repeat protein [Hyphomonadaceae bacterium]